MGLMKYEWINGFGLTRKNNEMELLIYYKQQYLKLPNVLKHAKIFLLVLDIRSSSLQPLVKELAAY